MSWVLNIKQSDVNKLNSLKEKFGITPDQNRKLITSQSRRTITTANRIVTSSKFRYRRELTNGHNYDKPLPSAKSFGCSSTNFCSRQSNNDQLRQLTVETLKTDSVLLIPTSREKKRN